MSIVHTLLVRPSLVVGDAGAVMFAVWTGAAPKADDVRACTTPLLQHAKAHKHAGIIVVTRPSMPLPDSEARGAIVAEMRKLDPFLVCGATIVSRGGFAGTALRAVASTLQLLSGPHHPEKIFANDKDAAIFIRGILARHVDNAPSIDAIASACADLTRQAWATVPDPAAR